MNVTRRRWLRVGLGLLVAGVAGLYVATRRAARSVDRRVDTLLETVDATTGPPVTPEAFEGLPGPVRRYFERVLPEGQRPVRAARIEQRGELLLGERWRPFTATQHFAVGPPGFVWDATVEVAPFLDARVVDASLDGEGTLRATVFGVPVADAPSGPELDEGELVRYLAEAVWLPTALLPSAGVEWTAVDDETARARLTHGGTTASVTVHFGENDLVEGVSTERYRQESDEYAPWTGEFGGYERLNGVLVPTEAEVSWTTPVGERPYWRGTVTHVEYDTGEGELGGR